MARPLLSEAVAEYLEHCTARRLSPRTVETRRSTLNRLVIANKNPYCWSVSQKHVDRVFSTHSWSPATRNSKLSTYIGFFKWCRAKGYMHRDNDPLFGWKSEKLPKQNRLRIPHSEWPRLFDACRHENETMSVALGLYLFLRSNEKSRIRLGDVHLDRGEIDIYRSKTRDFDVMPISSELDGYLRAHLTWLAEQGITDPDYYLMPTRTKPTNYDGRGFMPDTCQLDPTRAFSRPHLIVQRVLSRAGYKVKNEGGHTLRRSGARAYFDSMVEQGYDGALKRVQAMLGHKNSAMTEVYLGLDLERRRRNESLAGKPMFPVRQDAKVVPIRKEM